MKETGSGPYLGKKFFGTKGNHLLQYFSSTVLSTREKKNPTTTMI